MAMLATLALTKYNMLVAW